MPEKRFTCIWKKSLKIFYWAMHITQAGTTYGTWKNFHEQLWSLNKNLQPRMLVERTFLRFGGLMDLNAPVVREKKPGLTVINCITAQTVAIRLQ